MVTREDYLKELVAELTLLPTETEWVEFKKNNVEPDMIGEYISAISNSATLSERDKGYIVWGIDDISHKILGTTFNYRELKVGAQELELWLSTLLKPTINFTFDSITIDGKEVVILSIDNAKQQPTQFKGQEYIRVGSTKKKLKDYPEKERRLWKLFDDIPDELRVIRTNNKLNDILKLFDYVGYYKRLNLSLPDNPNKILDDFINEKFIKKNDAGLYDITNLGAILIANDISDFESLRHKNVRVIWYKGNTKLETIREKRFSKGYALVYEELVEYIMTIIPQREAMEGSIRTSVYAYPEIAIREIVANVLVHQLIEQVGTSPMVEIFENRIEFSNAGAPLVAIERIVDTVPVSRNENLAGFMHKCGICEERGSGYDKVLFATSKHRMIAPKIENQSDKFTKVTLYSAVPFEIISKEDRIRTCYMYACLMYVQGTPINNNAIREVFGIEAKNKYIASRIIKDTLDANLIKAVDANAAPRYMKYIPFWG